MRKFFPILMAALLLAACSKPQAEAPAVDTGRLDRLWDEVSLTHRVDGALAYIDSLEQAGALLPPYSDYHRGLVYDAGWNVRMACYYYQRAVDAFTEPITDWDTYADAVYRLAYMRTSLQDYNAGLRLATSLLARADSLREAGQDVVPRTVYAFTMLFVAEGKQLVGDMEAAQQYAVRAYGLLEDKDSQDRVNQVIMAAGIVSAFLETGDLAGARHWLEEADKVLATVNVEEMDAPRAGLVDSVIEYRKHLSLLRARILLEQGDRAAADAEFVAVTDTAMARHPHNLDATVDYLLAAERYEEALEVMEFRDTLAIYRDWNETTFDGIERFLVPRYEANLKAGREAEALELAARICGAIDSAVAAQNKSDVAELSIVYETEQKDRALQRKEHEVRQHRLVIRGLILLLLIAAAVLWQIIVSGRRLREKNAQLYEMIEQMRRQEDAEQADALRAAPTAPQTPSLQLYQRICRLMQEQQSYTDSDLNRESLASLLGTNYNAVADAIREGAGGKTLGDFLDDWRLRHAARVLAETDEPIGLVVELSGFKSRSHFNALFREKYKLTPSEYARAA
ncbi:MAG: helix-turn-helix transcriptional regulator, partial [Bacteroidales bacterium]|nr:helix-turn-helix transcriptional regulator [Bacteroidales bacterium]